MQISLMVEGQAGLTWDKWRALVARVEDWGFAGLYRSDHFTMSHVTREDSLEMIVSLAYLADHTQRVHFGPLVAPLSFRDPVMLARQAAHLDALSSGRMILGVGAGWQVREHEMFGYPLLDKKARLERFAEGLQVISLLLKSEAPVSFEGRWYNLRDAEILPRPYKTKILVGGNGITQTLRLAARYADVWNGVQLSPSAFRERAKILDDYLYDAGRDSAQVKKTTATFLFFGGDANALEQRVARFRHHPAFAGKTWSEILAMLRHEDAALAGTPDDVIPQIQAYADAGVQELMLQIFDSDDVTGLDLFARAVLPHFG
jgi:alkanesulfonate monooxygenase SsuD/methylene tetrahydromethanopterin reductase-like flavin-dependent oxidoreductase (luciferase family)